MNLSQFSTDLLYLFTWSLGEITVSILGGAFLAAAFFYALAVVISYTIRSSNTA